MSSKKLIRTSKFLSLVLRHKPERVGLTLSQEGWVPIKDLLQALEAHGKGISRETLTKVVSTNDKQRFAISSDGLHIRASQGHSVEIDLGLDPQTPPPVLYHGTATRFIEAIRSQGLLKMNRRHVHLAADQTTAVRVGGRHGKPVVLTVDAAAMVTGGHLFYLSQNGVWLTDTVPPSYLGGCKSGDSQD